MRGLPKPSLLQTWTFLLCLLFSWAASWAQISDLRYSRISPPGLSETSQVLVRVTIDSSLTSLAAFVSKKVRERMEALGYAVSDTGNHDNQDLVLIVRCESTPDVLLALSSIPNHNGSGLGAAGIPPPCSMTYRFQGELIPWKKVDRLIYVEGVSAMRRLGDGGNHTDSEGLIGHFLDHYDFPVLLAAEWGHVHRLVQVLNDSGVAPSRKTLVIRLLGEIQHPEGFPVLLDQLHDPVLARAAAQALGCFALDGRPHLLKVLQTRKDPLLQTAAAIGLGKIAAMTGDSQPTQLFLDMISDPTVDLRVKTALVWALGKAPDFRAYPTLVELERTIWLDRSTDPQLQHLREAVNWSIREVKQGGHGDDF